MYVYGRRVGVGAKKIRGDDIGRDDAGLAARLEMTSQPPLS